MRRLGSAALLVFILAACGEAATTPTVTLPAGVDPVPPIEGQAAERGEELYREYCAACHQTDLSGDPDWRVRNDDGTYPPPPQDSSGHTWHHSDATLLSIVRDGWDDPLSRMPAFGDQLSDADIMDVLEYFKSIWGQDERTYQWLVTSEAPGS